MTINEKLDKLLSQQATLTERMPEDLKEKLQKLSDAQDYGCPALRKHLKEQRRAWWAVILAFIVATIGLFRDALSKVLGLH